MSRLLTFFLLAALVLGVLAPRSASAREICFPQQPDVKACFADPFSGYWETNGGLPVFGYPLSAAATERNPDLNTNLLTQWTERNRLEVHPENRPPFDILLGRMGAERLQQLGRIPAQQGRESGPRTGCLWFETTGINVCDQEPGRGFKTYWSTHGLKVPGLDAYGQSLQLFGYPLTTPRLETNATGDLVLTQWFERARFEWHPYKPAEFKVLLGLLGTEVRANPKQPQPLPVFGVEITQGAVPATIDRAKEAGTPLVRYGGINWAAVEPTRGARKWDALARQERELRALGSQGLAPAVLISETPAWAQQFPGVSCGPIKPEALDAFAQFVNEVVSRYGKAPYNVKYWEIWNEPDVDPGLVPPTSGFGCWGDQDDAYYGGGYYAEMLKRVYPAIKRADPTAQVMIGGLLLDCDPTNPPAGKDCKPAKFFEGILRGGGGAFFDIVAYHAYTYWAPRPEEWDRNHMGWRHRGGVLLGKLDFLRSVEAKYGVHKPLLMHEGGLLCAPGNKGCPSAAFYQDQANHLVRMYARTWSSGLLGATWYTLNGPGWREAGLLGADQKPRPAYNALKFMATLLRDAVYTDSSLQGPLERYAFRKGSTLYQIYWTNDGSTQRVSLPASTEAIYNRAGGQQAFAGGNVEVGFEPVFVVSKIQ